MLKTSKIMCKNQVIYNGYECIIVKIWENWWYDLKTAYKTEKGIIEEFLSVQKSDLIKQGNKLD